MTKIIIDIFMFLLEFVLLYYYSNSLFKSKKSKNVRIVTTFLCFVVLFIVYQFKITYINTVLMFAIYLFSFVFLYKVKLKSAVFHTVIFIVVMMAAELIPATIYSILFDDFNAFETDITAYIFNVIVGKFIYFSIMLILLKVFAQKENMEQQDNFYWMLFVMPLASIVMMISFRYVVYSVDLTESMSILWIISSVGVIFANILVFIIYERSMRDSRELYKLKSIKQQEELDKHYFEIIKQSNKDMRIFAHDIKNHLIQIRNFDDIDRVHNYVDTLVPDIEKFSHKGMSKNETLDIIISKYYTLCESKQINFSVDVKTANLSYINSVDLSTMMNNLLDNSVEAAQKAENGFIDVKIFAKNKLYDGMIIRNSCVQPPVTKNGYLKTTKEEYRLHGLGISSVKKIAKKYDAMYDWEYDDTKKVFITNMAFSKSDR